MIGIDELLDMLDWNNDPTIQAKGIELARDVKTTNPFVLPMDSKYGKNVWENCAKIINERSDEQIRPYLRRLFVWIGDLTLPGALIIWERLLKFNDTEYMLFILDSCKACANATNDFGIHTLLEFEAELIDKKQE